MQNLHSAGEPIKKGIYETIGVYFGYQIAYYAKFYDIRHVLIMGRVTSGQGGQLLLQKAQEVLNTEYPELAKKIQLHIPDENSRRVGQSVAAARRPGVKKEKLSSRPDPRPRPNAQRVFAKTRPIRVRNMKKF